MVSLKVANCPYCQSTSYFATNKTSGYCSECGKLIYFDKSDNIEFTEVANKSLTSQKAQTYTLFLTYSKRGPECSRTIIVNINGPERMQVAVNLNETTKIALMPGQYQIIGQCHVTAGVNSTDIVGSLVVDMRCDRRVNIETSGLFNRRMTIY